MLAVSVARRRRTEDLATPTIGTFARPSMQLATAPLRCSRSSSQKRRIAAISDSKRLVRLNVGGRSFILREGTIVRRAPDGRLADLAAAKDHQSKLEMADGYLESAQEYFFERSSFVFGPLYRYYISGYLQKPTDILNEEFLEELIYWRLVQTMAAEKYLESTEKDSLLTNANGERTKVVSDQFDNVRCKRLRRKLWNLAEEPGSSQAARAFAFCSVLFVIMSISALIIGSIPELQTPVESSVNDTSSNSAMEPHIAFTYVEYVCMMWFTGEYLLKFIVSARRWQFFHRFLNLIDIMAIVPFYLELSLVASGVNTEALRNFKAALLVIRILRVARVIRIFKLGRYSAGLQTFALTLKESMLQLGMMAMVMTTGVIFFSSLVYFLEKDEPNTRFPSIPAGFWWCIVTMTTVGYGDVVPSTIAGKLVASGAIVGGVFVLALPITIIVDNFMKVSAKTTQRTNTT